MEKRHFLPWGPMRVTAAATFMMMVLALLPPAAAAKAGTQREGGGGKAQAAGDSSAKPGPVDINTADVEKLTTLPGIGRAIAQRIVDYRKEHGPFKSVDELLNVRGIGDRSLAKLRDRLTVGGKN